MHVVPSVQNAPTIFMAVCSHPLADSLPLRGFQPYRCLKKFPPLLFLSLHLSQIVKTGSHIFVCCVCLTAPEAPGEQDATCSPHHYILRAEHSTCHRLIRKQMHASFRCGGRNFVDEYEGRAFPVFQITQVNWPVNYVSYESNKLFILSTVFN